MVLYSSEFIPALSIMRWMLIGGYFRIVSWVLAIPMLAYADMKTFFWTELIWDSLLLGFSATAVLGFHWLPGVGVGFVLLYSSYLVYTFWYTHRRFHLMLDRATVLQWLVGLILIVGASVQTWNDQQVQWPTLVFWLVLTLGFSGFVLNERERQGIMEIVLRKVWGTQIQ